MTKFNLINLYLATICDEKNLRKLRDEFQIELNSINSFKHKILWNNTNRKNRDGDISKKSEKLRSRLKKIDSILLHKTRIRDDKSVLNFLKEFKTKVTLESWLELK